MLLINAGIAQAASFAPIAPSAETVAISGHGLGVHFVRTPGSSVTTSAFTSTNGSMIIASVGRGVINDHATAVVNDNKGNGAYTQVGKSRNYTHWPTSGTALFQKTNIAGGGGHTVSASKPSLNDEVTVMAVTASGVSSIVDSQWNEDLTAPNVSASVTTTGPAILVSFWWGDDGGGELNPTVSAGWIVIEHTSSLASNHVQGAVAYRIVPSAGSYYVKWKPSTAQGAQIYVVALQ
jgi:hypothetical protein